MKLPDQIVKNMAITKAKMPQNIPVSLNNHLIKFIIYTL